MDSKSSVSAYFVVALILANTGCSISGNLSGISAAVISLSPDFDISRAPVSVPEGYPYSGLAQLKNVSGAIVYSLDSNTCANLQIDSATGELSGELDHLNTQTCTFKTKATVNGSTEFLSEVVTLDFTSPLSISFDIKNEMLKVGDSAKTVTLNISPAAPFDSKIPYQLVSLVGLDANLISGFSSQGTIDITSGSTNKTLSLQIPNTVSLTNSDYQSLTLQSGTSLSRPQLDLSIYKDESPDFVKVVISVSPYFVGCGLTADGKIYCWGSSSYGEFANGSSSSTYNSPVQIGSSSTWEDIDVNRGTVCGIDTGRLYCWGYNQYGQVGNGSTSTSVTTPYQVGVATTWTSVATGLHTCATNAGELYCWGFNDYGQIGSGSTGGNVLVPTKVGSFANWTKVSVGLVHTCGIETSQLYCWGRNNNLQLGNGVSGGNYNTPQTSALSGSWQDISAGENYSCGIRAGGVYCWGNNIWGGTMVNTHTPTQVGTSFSWTQVSSNLGYNCGINSGQLYCWGSSYGSTGPQLIESSTDWTGMRVTGMSIACGVKNSKISCIGSSLSPVGNGNASGHVYSPMNLGTWTDWTQISAGRNHSCGIRAGFLYCWGSDGTGSVGNGSLTGNINSPQKIGFSNSWSEVSVGELSTCAIKNSELFCWGYNATNGSSMISPLRVGSDTGWSDVSTGEYNVCAIKSGELFCGLIGAAPAKIGSSNQWTRISLSLGGSNFRCGIDGGKLFCWGNNFNGQLGLGYTSASVANPTQVGVATNWTSVFGSRNPGTGGSENACAIKAGELFCWGNNSYGKNANGLTTGNVLSPTKVGVLTGWTRVQQSQNHSCGIESGRLLCWGNNQYGQIGNGLTNGANVLTPSQVGTSTNWTEFSILNTAVLAIGSGQLQGFGFNFQFKMDRTIPVQLIEFP